MSQEQDQIFFRNFTLVVGAIAVMMVLFFIAAKLSGGSAVADNDAQEERVAEITTPVGQVAVEGEESVAEAEEIMPSEEMAAEEPVAAEGNVGETVYNGLCVNCHGMAAMAAMMPQRGDATAWEARIAKGIDTLYDHAINGFTGDMGMMPAKGGNPGLSDDEVKAAVDYILEAL